MSRPRLGGVCPEGGCPGPDPRGVCLGPGPGGVGVCPEGVSRPRPGDWGGGLSRPGGVCIPACTETDTPAPSRRLLLRAVHILLECILVFSINLYCTFSFRWEETTSTNETRRRHGNRQYMSWRYIISTRYSNILHWALTFHSTRLSLENLATCCIPFSLMRKGLTLFFLAVKKIIS